MFKISHSYLNRCSRREPFSHPCSLSVLQSVSLCWTVVLPPSLCVWQRAETYAPLLINLVERRTIVRRWSGFHDNAPTEWDATPASLLFFSAPPTLQRISGAVPKPDSVFSTNYSKKPRLDPFDSVELTRSESIRTFSKYSHQTLF